MVLTPEDVFGYAHALKVKGNSLFKQKLYGCAADNYAKAVKALCFVTPYEKEGEVMLRDLAITLNLNLAMCALKRNEFAKSKDLCCLVLRFDTKNVKALFRRGMSYRKLGELEAAFKDLTQARNLDPENREVIEECVKVESLLAGTCDTKRHINDGDSNSVPQHFKKQKSSCNIAEVKQTLDGAIHGDPPMTTRRDSCSVSQPNFYDMNSDAGLKARKAGESTLHSKDVSNSAMEIDPPSNDVQHTFVNPKKRNSTLRISNKNLRHLMKGKDILFYHPSSFSLLQVRVIPPKTQISKEAPHNDMPREAAVSKQGSLMEEESFGTQTDVDTNPILTPWMQYTNTQHVVPPPRFVFTSSSRKKASKCKALSFKRKGGILARRLAQSQLLEVPGTRRKALSPPPLLAIRKKFKYGCTHRYVNGSSHAGGLGFVPDYSYNQNMPPDAHNLTTSARGRM